MRTSKKLVMEVVGAGVFLSLLWGVSSSISAPPVRTKSSVAPGIERSVEALRVQPRLMQHATPRNPYRAKPDPVQIAGWYDIVGPGVGVKGKVKDAEPAGKSLRINRGQAVTPARPQRVQSRPQTLQFKIGRPSINNRR